jgi:hypothetical protein
MSFLDHLNVVCLLIAGYIFSSLQGFIFNQHIITLQIYGIQCHVSIYVYIVQLSN